MIWTLFQIFQVLFQMIIYSNSNKLKKLKTRRCSLLHLNKIILEIKIVTFEEDLYLAELCLEKKQ